MALIGLQYVGQAAGISVMLFKSYKSVKITWDKPYRFTEKDDVSGAAKVYYLKHYKKLGVNLIEEIPADTEPKDIEKVRSGEINESNEPESIPEVIPESEPEIPQVENEPEISNDTENKIEDEPDNSAVESNDLDSIKKQIIADYGVDVIQSASESDIGEILDSKFSEDQIYQVAKAVGYDYGRTRKKSKVINGMLESNLNEVVAFILS